MNVVCVLRELNLHLLDDVWVNEALNFQVNDFPESYNEFLQEVDINSILRDCSVALNEWSSYSQGENGISCNWSILLQHNVKSKALVALIGYMLQQSSSFGETSWLTSLLWSEFYFLLLAVPGSSACKVFDAIVYSKSLATFEVVKLALGNNRKASKSRKSRSQHEHSNADDCEINVNLSFSNEDKLKIINGVNSLFKSFSQMLNSFSLRVSEMTLINTVETLSNLSRIEGETSRYPRDFGSQTGLQMVSCNAFLCLQCICSHLHGNVQENFKLISKYLLPSLILKGGYGFEANFVELKNICSRAVHFLQFMITTLGEPAHEGVSLLVKHTCLKTVEKADFRHQSCVTIVLLLRSLPAKPHKELVKWLLLFSHQEKASYRLFGLEIISKLVFDKERVDEHVLQCPAQSSVGEQVVESNGCETGEDVALDVLSSQERRNMLDKYFLAIIFGRCNDASSAVRAKALSVIADCMTLEYPDAQDIMSAIFVRPYENFLSAYESDIEENGFINHAYLIQCFDQNMNIDPLPGGKAVISLIKKIFVNTSVQVTKSALRVLENVMLMSEKWMADSILEVMCQFCRSSSVIIRKSMIDCLTKLLLAYPRNNSFAKLWVKKVLMQVDDQESTVKEKAVQAACAALINNIEPANSQENTCNMLPWVLLNHTSDLNMRGKLISVCSLWLRENRTQSQLSTLLLALQTHANTEHRAAAWLMIRCLSSEISSSNTPIILPSPDFFYESFRAAIAEQHLPDSEVVLTMILEVLQTWWKLLPAPLWTAVLGDLQARLDGFSVVHTLVSPVMETARAILENSREDGREAFRAFACELIEMCDEHLKTVMKEFVFWKNENSFEACLRHVLTLGSAVLACPDGIKKDTFRMLLLLTFPHTSKLPGAVELLGAHHQLGKIQVAGMITLARYGLVNDTYVKQIARSLADLLTSNRSADVKHNTILILTDLCARYTSVVEPLLPSLYLCLKDGDRRIRRTMLISFIELLNTEYLKPKGALFLYLLTMLCDPDNEVKLYIKSYITKCLILKNKTVMASNFPESLFFYNDYKTHSTYGRFHTSVESQYFKMSGPKNKHKRQLVYRFMLKHMTDDQRFTTAQKLCSDILDAVEESISLEGPGLYVVQDTLFALLSDEIRLNRQRCQLEDDDPADETEAAAATEIAALKNTISEVHKRNAIETILPVLKHLKEKLENSLSPLVEDVNLCLRNMMMDYRKEVEEYFKSNNDFITLGQVTELLNQFKKPAQPRRSSEHANDNAVVEAQGSSRPATEATQPSARVSRRSVRRQGDTGTSPLQQRGERPVEGCATRGGRDSVRRVSSNAEVARVSSQRSRAPQAARGSVPATQTALCRMETETAPP